MLLQQFVSVPALAFSCRVSIGLTSLWQLTEYGAAAPPSLTSKEDGRSTLIAARARRGEYDDELILEQLARNRVFLGDAGLSKLRSSFVIVVGLGGVGSHATAALARSGVSRIRVIDFDQVTLSSLNRHAVATLADVGTPKVHCMRKRLEQITPWLTLDCRNELFSSQVAEKLLGGWDYELHNGEERDKRPDYVIDCIDNIDSKVALLQYCYRHSVKVISSMGAGCKSDPTRVCVGDISGSIEDPLSRATRRRLKMLGVKEGIPVIFSTEKPGPGKAALLPLSEDEFAKGQVGELSVLPDFRVRILPVLGTMPAMFGYAAATHVICELAGYPHEYRAGEKGRDKMYEGMLSALQGLEERLARSVGGQDAVGLRLPLSKDDVQYLVEEVFRGRSVVGGLANRLALIRWRQPEGGYKIEELGGREGQRMVRLKLGDLVCMTKEEAQRHENEVLKGDREPESLYEAEVVDLVARRLAEEKVFDKYR
jgi:tRNA A37 threonylcarbamoyladenosine dehydratase